MEFSPCYVVYRQRPADCRNACARKLCSRASARSKGTAVLELQPGRLYLAPRCAVEISKQHRYSARGGGLESRSFQRQFVKADRQLFGCIDPRTVRLGLDLIACTQIL